ncbi:hypothetical protein [Rhodocaloribacter sp.]
MFAREATLDWVEGEQLLFFSSRLCYLDQDNFLGKRGKAIISPMKRLKTEIQIRFDTVADMSWHARSILAPFRQFATNIQILHINRPEERVLLEFAEESHVIILDWNMLALVSQGNFSGWKKRDGLLRFFFDAFEKTKDLPSYSGIESIRVLTWSVLSDHYAEVSSFREKYFSEAVPEGDEDAAIVVTGVWEENCTFELRFGPYQSKSDPERHNLYVFPKRNDPFAQLLDSLRGTLIRAEVSVKGESDVFKAVVDLLEKAETLTRRIK